MKQLLVLLALASTSAFATEFSELPKGLKCEAKSARNPDVRVVEITKMNTDSPESTTREGLQEVSIDGNTYSVSFSDECEAWYAFEFKVSDLLSLKAGKVKTITGNFSYNELPEFFPDVPADTQENQDDSVIVTCKLLK